MARYLKLCPRCRHPNPENAFVCEVCDEFIGDVQPQEAALSQDAADSGPVEGEGEPSPSSPSHGETPSVTRQEPATTLLYLEMPATGDSYRIGHDDQLGQQHPDSPAEVQIQYTLHCDNIRQIHRQHCRFEFESGRWWLIPLDQRQFGRSFTNSTRLNDKRLAPGQRYPLSTGDRLNLAGVDFLARVA